MAILSTICIVSCNKNKNRLEVSETAYYKYGIIADNGKEVFPVYDEIYDFYKGYAVVIIKEKFGLINKEGTLIVPVKYDYIFRCDGNLIAVRNNNKWALFDKTGKQVTDFKYDGLEYVQEGFYVVRVNNKLGVIDEKGKEIIPEKYEKFEGNFNDGILAVSIHDKWGYVNSEGKEITPIKYEYADEFKDGRAKVNFNYKEGLIDKNGKVIVPLIYNDLFRLGNGLSDVGVVNEKDRLNMGVVNEKNGKLVTSLKYEDLYNYQHLDIPFSGKLARIQLNDKIGLVDDKGKIIVPILYDSIDSLGDVFVITKGNKYGYLDKKGKIIVAVENDCYDADIEIYGLEMYHNFLLLLSRNDKYGFADRKGNKVTPIKYDSIRRKYLGGVFVSINKKSGYVNESGKEVIPAIFDIPMSKMNNYFNDGIFIYKEKNKWSAMDSTGIKITNRKYDSMTDFSGGFSIAASNGNTYIIDKKGKAIETLKYDQIKKSGDGIVVSINKKMGLLDKNNILKIPVKYDEIKRINGICTITKMNFNKYSFPVFVPAQIFGFPIMLNE